MLKTRWAAALLVLAGLVLQAQAQTPAKLQWNFQKDKPFYQEVKTTTTQDMTISNQKITQKQSQTFYFSWTPKSYDEKTKTWNVVQKIEGVKLNIEVGGTKIDYDSTKDTGTANPLSDFFKQLVGSEFRMTVGADGKIKEINAEDKKAFMDKLARNNTQMDTLLKEILNDESFKQMADPSFAGLPDNPVAPNGSWTRTYTLNMGPIGKYEVTNKYTYVGKDKTNKDLDRIDVTSTVVYKAPDVKSGGQLPFKIEKANLKSEKSSGHLLFDPKKGQVVSSDMDLTIGGKLDISIGGMTTAVDLTQVQKTTVKTQDKPFLEKEKETKKEK